MTEGRTKTRENEAAEFLDEGGIWRQMLGSNSARSPAPCAALFLDRDGVIVKEVPYLHRPEDRTFYSWGRRDDRCGEPGWPARCGGDYHLRLVLGAVP